MIRLLIVLLTCLATPALAQEVPREILVLYDGATHSGPRNTTAHRFAEMPLNHLGFVLRYYDANQELPPVNVPSVRGVLIWFDSGTQITDSPRLLNWFEAALDADKKLVIMGELGVENAYRDTVEGMQHIRRLLRRIGVEDHDSWFNVTYDAQIEWQDPVLTRFERRYGGGLPGYYHMTVYGSEARSHLRVRNKTTENAETASDLIITHPQGAYVATDYAKFEVIDEGVSRIRQWYIDPFAFFSQVFAAQDWPKPDVTTLNGRRIFYSHIDGDGWNNLSEIAGYHERKALSAEVLQKEIFERYTDIPFSVGIIVNEIEQECYGVPASREIAQRIFALPNIEPTSHTLSHPLYWGYFADNDPNKEQRFLSLYPPRPESARSIYSALVNWVQGNDKWNNEHAHTHQWREEKAEPARVTDDDILASDYVTPRSYACRPFDINLEIIGSLDYVQKLAPPDKQVKLIQWSGNTAPFASAIRLAREVGVLNINGGDTRLDREYPSYAYVAPIGVQVGQERQIYSSNSNENTYTNLWTDRFFGFQFLTRTVRNTETPRRITPFNVYFHTYSGSKQPSLEAVRANLDFALKQDIIPLFTSDYAQIANDFYHTRLVALQPGVWRVEERGALNTLRFDRATRKTVDWNASRGVIGQRHLNGSLYVSLDPAEPAPVVAVKPLETIDLPAKAPRPYLIRSRWKIKDLHYFNNLLTSAAEGFGPLGMEWVWPDATPLTVKIHKGQKVLIDTVIEPEADGRFVLNAALKTTGPVIITVTPVKSSLN